MRAHKGWQLRNSLFDLILRSGLGELSWPCQNKHLYLSPIDVVCSQAFFFFFFLMLLGLMLLVYHSFAQHMELMVCFKAPYTCQKLLVCTIVWNPVILCFALGKMQ